MGDSDSIVNSSDQPTALRREGGITLSSLRAFAAVAEAKSVSGAARLLGVSQPSVSIQLAALEQACGVLLFRRKPQFVLTEVGQELFVRARLILSRVSEFEASALELRDVSRGRLSIGLSTPHVAMPLIAGFTARHPAVSITTKIGNTTTLLDDIARCRIDIGMMTLTGPVAPFACTLISAPRLAVCLPSDDPMAARPAVRASELAGRAFILREEGSLTRQVLEAAFAADGLTLNIRLVLGSREAMKEAVAARLGLGALFEGEAGHDTRLAIVPFVSLPCSTGVYAVSLKESLEIPAVRAFVDHIPAGA